MRGYGLVALLFARNVSDPLTSLVKTLDKQLEASASQGTSTRKLGVYIVFCNDDPTLNQHLQKWLVDAKLKHVVLCTHNAEGPRAYRVAKEADLTAVIYGSNRRVLANFPLKPGDLNESTAKDIVQAVTQVLPKR